MAVIVSGYYLSPADAQDYVTGDFFEVFTLNSSAQTTTSATAALEVSAESEITAAAATTTTATNTLSANVNLTLGTSTVTVASATASGAIDINIASGLSTDAARLAGANISIPAAHQISAVPKINRGGQSTIASALAVSADAVDADLGVVILAGTLGVTASASVLSANAASVIASSSVSTTATNQFGFDVTVANSTTTTTLGNQIHDPLRDPYDPGYDYTWDNVGLYDDWDTWPKAVWGPVEGAHIGSFATTNVTGGFIAAGIGTVNSTSTVTVDAVRNRAATVDIALGTVTVVTGGELFFGDIAATTTSVVNVTGNLIHRSAEIDIALGTVTATVGERVVYGDIVAPAQSSVSVTAQNIIGAISTLASTTSLTTTGNAVFAGSINISLGTVTATIAAVQTYDPYRTATVYTESRTLMVLDEYARTESASSETRTYKIPVPQYLAGTRTRIN